MGVFLKHFIVVLGFFMLHFLKVLLTYRFFMSSKRAFSIYARYFFASYAILSSFVAGGVNFFTLSAATDSYGVIIKC